MKEDLETAYLFVHGIQGSPAQFSFLTERLPEDIRVRNLLLPGHGADVKAFRRTGREQWLGAVRQAAEELRGQCGRLIFVGHSMGCLLGLEVERERPGTFAGMVLLCCPFCIRPTARYARNSLRASRPEREADDDAVRAAREANSVTAAHPTQYLTCVYPYLELLRLMRTVRKDGETPACPVRFLFSEKDEIVSPRSAYFARERFTAEPEILPGCGHNWFSAEGKERIYTTVKVLIQPDQINTRRRSPL